MTTADRLVGLDEILAARDRIAGRVHRTPMLSSATAAERIAAQKPDALILSGGPRSVLEPGAPDLDLSALKGIPMLGICYGQQLMAHRLGGKVEANEHKEYGHRRISLRAPHQTSTPGGALLNEDLLGAGEQLARTAVLDRAPLVDALTSEEVWMSHGDQVLQVPPGFVVTATTESCPVAAMEHQ
jgi:GMP synthase (glutamine-hydrolysing)